MKKVRLLAAIHPNAGLEAIYRKRLEAAVKAMHDDVAREIEKLYAAKPPEMAGDESPAMAMRGLMARLGRKWLGKFDTLSQELADYFAKSSLQRTDAALKSILRRGGFSVKFQMTREVNDILQATIGENVSLIKSIASQHFTEIEGLVMRSVTAGRDLKSLADGLQQRYKVTRHRAAFIARDQNNKATANINMARQTALGITEGVWRHSRGGNHPRPDHVRFSGTKFSLKKGHDFGDGFGSVLPGQAINCRCTWSPIISALA